MVSHMIPHFQPENDPLASICRAGVKPRRVNVNCSTKLLRAAVGFNSSLDRARSDVNTTLLKCGSQLSKARALRTVYSDDWTVEAVTVLEQDLSEKNIDLTPQSVHAGDTCEPISWFYWHKNNKVERS